MSIKKIITLILFLSVIFLGAGFLTAKDSLLICSGKYSSDKNKIINLRAYLSYPSPLFFWGNGTLQVNDELLFVKKELNNYAFYSSGKYAGSLDKNLLEIFIDFPNHIYEGQCKWSR